MVSSSKETADIDVPIEDAMYIELSIRDVGESLFIHIIPCNKDEFRFWTGNEVLHIGKQLT